MRNHPEYPLHFPLRKFDRNARTNDLLAPEQGAPSRHILYRFYDSDLRPIYIGITSIGEVRLDTHRKRSEWWPLAEYVAISAYRTYEQVKEAERAAIRHERPRFNKQAVRGRAIGHVPLHGDPADAAAYLFREAMPEFVAALAELLAQPERFPQPSPPPPARFAEEADQ